MTVLDTPIGQQCLTEVVVTTAAVTVAGTPGWGCVLGWDAEAALAAALADAADPAAADRLAETALRTEERERAVRTAQVRTTRMEVA
jgi:alpha-D-ribose 1-methylphosphonate 5-triphosphate synthase subunit PhnG